MYTNVSNIIKSIIKLLGANSETIDAVVSEYEGSDSKGLSVFEGMRKTLPADAFPSLEIEPTSGSTEWYSCRAQRPRYNLQFTLTVKNDNEDYGVEYIATLANILIEILTTPKNLQLQVLGEKKYDSDIGLVDTYLEDSLVENVSYNASKDGTIRTVQFDYFATVHEPFPESQWGYGTLQQPTEVRNNTQVP